MVLETLNTFIAELRSAGLPISVGEHLDAAQAAASISLGSRENLRLALSSALVKRAEHQAMFNHAFALYFATLESMSLPGRTTDDGGPNRSDNEVAAIELSANELVDHITDALVNGAAATMRALAALAVDRYAGIEAGRPVGSAYYLYRTMRHLRLDEVETQLANRYRGTDASAIEQLVAQERAAVRVDEFRDILENEILTQLVNDRGSEVMAAATRRELLEDVDVMRANREELLQLEKTLLPLSRKLAARLARKRRKLRRGPLDMRRTIRASLSTGGVPLRTHQRSPHPVKPELVVLADMSGSVASFARFTLLLVHALHGEFSKIRSFVFVDAVDEVTKYFATTDNPSVAADRIANEAEMVASDGHSDYGRVLAAFREQYSDAANPRATLLILGDARGNYHPARSSELALLTRRFKRTFWLNPEPQAYWHSGDSVIGEYAVYCDEVVECRTLRQLEAFVMGLS